jgi:hypothetical protein
MSIFNSALYGVFDVVDRDAVSSSYQDVFGVCVALLLVYFVMLIFFGYWYLSKKNMV